MAVWEGLHLRQGCVVQAEACAGNLVVQGNGDAALAQVGSCVSLLGQGGEHAAVLDDRLWSHQRVWLRLGGLANGDLQQAPVTLSKEPSSMLDTELISTRFNHETFWELSAWPVVGS